MFADEQSAGRRRPLIPFALCALLLVPASNLAQDTPSTRQRTLVQEGLALLEASKVEAAKAPLEEARVLSHAAGDVATEAAAVRALGLVRQFSGDVVGARALFGEAVRLYASIGDRRGMGNTHNSIGLMEWRVGNWPAVRAAFLAAADDYDVAGDQGQRAANLRNVTFDATLSDAEKVDILRRAWEIVRPVGNARQEGLILQQWGDTLIALGDYGAALEKLESAARLLEQGGAPLEKANVATSLGRAYRLHGLPEQALTYHRQALAVGESVGNRLAITQGLRALSVVTAELGRHAEALDYAKRALESARAASSPPIVADAVTILAYRELEIGRYADARAAVEEIQPAAERGVITQEQQLFFWDVLSRADAGLGRFDEAATAADRAVSLGEALARGPDLSFALQSRARLRLSRADANGARADIQRAIAILERMRATLPPRDLLKQGFADILRDVFTLAIDLDVTLRDPATALVMAEQARARAFQDLLATRELSAVAPTGALADRSAVAPTSAPSGAKGGGLASGASVDAPSLAEMKAVVARLHAPLLAYWVAPHETFIWILTPGGTVDVHRTKVEATTLEALASGSAQTSAKPGVNEFRELYELLIRPVRATLQAEPATRLTIIPHGPLFRVSFAALTDERGRYLVERYELHYAPAVGVLRFTEKNVRRHAVTSALLVGDPELPPQASADTFQPLPGARLEVADAARLLGGHPETLVGRQATEARVRALAGGRDVLHFATHGVVTDRNPLDSYLAFARSGGDAAADGRLTAAEIYGLDISADLVVLSACRSGAGKVTGDGIIGLTRGFFYAGAPSVLATLWDLADQSTPYLMRRFYTHWRQGASKAAALRAAQLDTIRALRGGRITAATRFGPVKLTESPALWAAFVLLGEP